MSNVFFSSAWIDAALLLGRFILRCSRCVHRAEDPGFETEPRPVCLLPESNSPDARSIIATIRLGGPADLIRLYPVALPDLSYIRV